MILKKGSFEDFAQRVKSTGKRVIVYGAGVIGQTAAPYWLHRHQLGPSVTCYVDADVHKQGTIVPIGLRRVSVQSLDVLEQVRDEVVLLVAVSAFEPVLRTLEGMPNLQNAEIYFLPIMLLDIAHAPKSAGAVRTSELPLIPKTIHYCWFSGNPIPERLQKCMESWKRFCPDYEIVRWDESSYDIRQYKYMEQAYAQGKWGFVPDIARLDILYRYGGIYLDTDVELIQNLDPLLYTPAFCGTEKWGTVNFGGCSGAQAGNPVVKAVLDFRKDLPFLYEDGAVNQTTCGYYETAALMEKGFEVNGTRQVLAEGMMTVFSSDFFHPFDYMSGETRLTPNTFSIHHFSGSWLGAGASRERQRTREAYQRFLTRLGE